MSLARQIFTVTALSLRTLRLRIKASLVIVVGVACVAIVLLFMLSAFAGIEHDYLWAGDPDRAIVLSIGAFRDIQSAIPRAWLNIIKDAPGIGKAQDGSLLADAQIDIWLSPIRKSRKQGYTRLLGMGAAGFAMSPGFRLVAGRMVHPGAHELIAGLTAQDEFIGLHVGDSVKLRDGGWKIVGAYSTGTFIDGDLIADTETLMTALRLPNYNSVLVRLNSPQSFTLFKKALTKNPALSVTVERHSDYWMRLFKELPVSAITIFYMMGSLIAAGTVSGTAHTMQVAVEARARETAILRAVGFGGFAVAASVVLEAMMFACAGAAIGTAIDWWLFDGVAYNGAYGVFRMLVTPHLFVIAIGWALAIAFLGALFPALRAARGTVVEAMQNL